MNRTVFTEDLEKKTITVKRTFSAPLDKVWSAWTERELLEQWWGPEPYRAVSKSFDFREGGHWHYYMESPDGDRHWCLVEYKEIQPKERFFASDCFCDEDRNPAPQMPGNDWENQFTADGDQTHVLVTLTFVSAEELQRTMEMGFKEGFSMGLEQLENLLKRI